MFTYPPAYRSDVVDDYHGTAVADPYRWMEDPNDAETIGFVEAQSDFSADYLTTLPARADLHARMTQLWDVPRTYLPIRRGNVTVWGHNDGLSNQPVYFVQIGDEVPRVLIDVNSLSDDGTMAINVASLSSDGSIFSYSVAEAGSDWQIIHFLDTATGEKLPDEIHHVKWTSVTWHDDGFFYARFPEVDHSAVTTVNNPSVCFHVMGTAQDDDRLVFNNADDPDPGYDTWLSHDGRFLFLSEYVGTSRHNGLLFQDLEADSTEWIRIVEAGVGVHQILAHHEGRFILRTDVDAPNGRIVAIPTDDLGTMIELVPEQDTAIELAAASDGGLLIVNVDDGSHVVQRYDADGTRLGAVDLPSRGSIADISAQFTSEDAFLSYQSFVEPPQALHIDRDTSHAFGDTVAANPDVEVSRMYATSTDGATVGMFVLKHKDTTGPAPVDLYGYGGFTINMTPIFNPARIAFLEQGGVVVVCNLRGGVEHGESWHQQGMLGNKQQVFDDFVACAEHLIAEGVTTAGMLSISGRSNGGLLTAATMLQRPDLFGAVVSHVPVTDMYRYQHFTAGRYWTVEYGDAADPEAFAWLSEYSPLHNVDPEVAYPPTLVTTAEGDDRVVPMHAYKFAATLQHAAGGASEQPLLLRIDRRAGHGMGKPTDKLIDEWADCYAFVLQHCGAAT